MNRRTQILCLILSLLILSCGGGGGGGDSASPNVAPTAPVGVTITGGNAQTLVSWRDGSGSTADQGAWESDIGKTTYNIYWSKSAGVAKKTGTKISGVVSPYYHSGLENGTPYYYVVTAVNSYGESGESAEVSATPREDSLPLPPKDVAAFGFNKKAIIRWTPADEGSNDTSHNLYWSTSSGVKKDSGTRIANAISPYTHFGLTNDTTYYYVVTSVNPYGESPESKEVSVTPSQGNVPSAPTGVKADAGDRQAKISWNVLDNTVTFNLYWSTSADVSSASGTRIAKATSPYTHEGLTQGETYYYIVTAENGFGESNDSDKASVTIPDTRKDICVAMGDSITVGDAASSYAKSYVPLLAARWGKGIVNEAVGGAYSAYGELTIEALMYEHNPRYVTIYFGTNDAGLVDPDLTIAHLQYVIAKAKENGTIPVIATLGPCFDEWAWRKPYMIDLSQRIRQLAASEGIACADVETALGWNKSYMANSLHPNDEGHRIIADTFYKALTR